MLSWAPLHTFHHAGAVAGAFAITISQPLDTVRVRLQQSSHADGKNTLQLLREMLRKEGPLSPWKGLTYPLLFASFQSAVLFQVRGALCAEPCRPPGVKCKPG